MGRYPLLEVAKHYLEKRRGFIARSTYKEWERKFRYMNSVLAKLRKEKKVDTTSPAKLSAKDVSSFMEWGREKGIQAATMEKYVMLLAKLCAYSGNPVFERMRAEWENFPRRTPKDLKALGPQDLEAIQRKAGEMSGWRGEVARLIVVMYPYSGLRPSELRLAHIEDLDIKKWQIWVRHPKGEGKYARQRFAPILYPARETVLKYLKAREVRLKHLGIDKAEPLVPAYHEGEIGYYSDPGMRGIKGRISDDMPEVHFSLKTFRDTFCQMNIDRNPNNLSAVSVSMGHSTTRTTERHYGRLKQEQALEQLQQVWMPSSVQNRLIEPKGPLSGYA